VFGGFGRLKHGFSHFRSASGLDETVLERFRPTAQQMIDERGAVDALAATLALLTGQTKVSQTSLINADEVRTHGHLISSTHILFTHNNPFTPNGLEG